MMTASMKADNREIMYSQFLSLVDKEYVASVEVTSSQINIKLKPGVEEAAAEILNSDISQAQKPVTYYTGVIFDPGLSANLYEKGVDYKHSIPQTASMFTVIASWVIPFGIAYIIYFFFTRSMMKRMGGDSSSMGFMGGVSKSKAKVYNVEKNVAITFKDVAGQDEAKESLVEIIDFLHNPEKYVKVGAKQPKGALLVGPPGTGKTLLARAIAGEAKVPFYHLTGSEFVELYVGVGASRVRDLFQTASKDAPCIIFIDEIDAIGKSRDNSLSSNDEREQTLNQLLSEMDGFDPSRGIVVLASTNRPEVLDKALLRAGRFDRRVVVEKPDLIGRESILKVHASKVIMGDDISLHEIALATSGATGADLANIINEAALRAVRLGREFVIQEDLMESVEVVVAGKEKKDRILNSKEKELVAYHEVGHALVSVLQKNSQPIQKITIVPRTMGSLGYTMNVPEEDRYLMTREDLLSQITMMLGGRAAEIVKFDTITTGSSNDIERATSLARNIITIYGMSDRFGPMGLESTTQQYLDGRKVLNCSDDTGSEIDEEVRKILDSCQQAAIDIIAANMDSLDRIAKFLIEKENINGEEFMKLLNDKDKTSAA
ncbi:MAG: ATP-dependent zinc metalloprotease FtsH [Eubacteriaceae bacterium]|nr:ATP-dependent zinc metalloprotease FtsH [Eubacteriaceae bacterium]